VRYEGGRRLRIEELYHLYFSPGIILVIKSRRMSWAEHVESLKKGGVHRGIWRRNLRERGHMEDIGVDGRIILK